VVIHPSQTVVISTEATDVVKPPETHHKRPHHKSEKSPTKDAPPTTNSYQPITTIYPPAAHKLPTLLYRQFDKAAKQNGPPDPRRQT
jgi:hypothetical protein